MTRETNHGSGIEATGSERSEARFRLLTDLAAWFAGRGVCAYVVGGAVRDWFLGRVNPDIDLAVRGSATELARDLAAAWEGAPVELDAERDTARVVLVRRPGRPEIDMKSFTGTIEDDLRARDLTINALAVPLARVWAADWRADVIDPVGGLADLKRRELRWASPEAPKHDPLRLLRAIRLAAVLDFTLPAETRAILRKWAPLLPRAAPERIRDELFAALDCPAHVAAEALSACAGLGLTEAVWRASASASCPADQPDWESGVHAVRRLAALLGEGTDACLSLRQRESFTAWLQTTEAANHTRRQLTLWFAFVAGVASRAPAETVEVIACQSLKLSRRERSLARTVGATRQAVERFLVESPQGGSERLRFFRRVGGAAPYALLAAGVRLPARLLPRVAETLDEYFAQGPTAKPDSLVNGRELARRLGPLSGRQLGKLLRLLEEAHADGVIATPAEATDFARRALTGLVALDSATRPRR